MGRPAASAPPRARHGHKAAGRRGRPARRVRRCGAVHRRRQRAATVRVRRGPLPLARERQIARGQPRRAARFRGDHGRAARARRRVAARGAAGRAARGQRARGRQRALVGGGPRRRRRRRRRAGHGGRGALRWLAGRDRRGAAAAGRCARAERGRRALHGGRRARARALERGRARPRLLVEPARAHAGACAARCGGGRGLGGGLWRPGRVHGARGARAQAEPRRQAVPAALARADGYSAPHLPRGAQLRAPDRGEPQAARPERACREPAAPSASLTRLLPRLPLRPSPPLRGCAVHRAGRVHGRARAGRATDAAPAARLLHR